MVKIFAWVFERCHKCWAPGGSIRCLVVGYGGANNTGSEARTACAIDQMLAADPRIDITLTSLDRRQTFRYLVESERLHVVQINPVFIISMLKLVLRADIVVLIEGSCFKENFSSALLWFFMYSAELAQRLGIPTVTYGVDAGALSPANRRWAKDVATKIDLLMVRTNAAAQVLRSIGVDREIAVTTDAAFSLKPEGARWAQTVLAGQGIDMARPIVGIAFEEFFWWPVVPSVWRALLGIDKDRYKSIYYHSWGGGAKEKSRSMKEQVAAYANWVAAKYDAQVVLFAMEHLDIRPCRDVQGLMKSRSILIDADHANARQIAALLRQLDWLITCRYHALVFAMGGGVPTVGLAHDERIAAILDELGLIDDAFISYEETEILELLKEKTCFIEKGAQSISRKIRAALPAYLARNEGNRSQFEGLVKKRFPA